MHKSISILLSMTLYIGLTVSVLPQANATIDGHNFIREVTGLPFHPRVVDVDSSGFVFVLSYDGDIWRSSDAGETWKKVAEDGYAGNSGNNLQLFVDSHDHVFATLAHTGTDWNLTRSVDHGDTWMTVLQTKRAWHMDEATNNSLWFHTYTTTWASIHRSDDGGTTWSTFHNFSLSGTDLRGIGINDFNDSEVWAFSGRWLKKWNGTGWTTYNQKTLVISDVWFDSNYVYFGSESIRKNFRYKQGADPISEYEYDYYWDAGNLTYVDNEHSFDSVSIGGLMLFGIRSQLWGSIDGTRWVKIVDLGDSIASDIASISNRRPIYFVDRKLGKLYHLAITKEDIVHLYYQEYLNHRGSLDNSQNYVLEQRISNGTNYLDFTNVALSNVGASIKGLSSINQYGVNSGFESGSTNEWTITSTASSGTHDVSTSEKYEGYYSLFIRKNAPDLISKIGYQDYRIVRTGDVLVWSGFVKGNITSQKRIMLCLRNQTSGSYLLSVEFDLTTSWQRISVNYALNAPSVGIRAEFVAKKGIDYEVYMDAFTFRIFEVEYYRQAGNSKSESVIHMSSLTSYTSSMVDTMNPILTISDETMSHSGQLANGSESSATNFSGILLGVVQVEANIQGSGQAILRIVGTRILFADSMVLKGRTSSVYYGRYYGVLSLLTTTDDLIALTNLASNITSISYNGNQLAVIIEAPTGMASTTKIYSGNKGQPRNVTGAASWNYDSESRIITISTLHSSSTTVVVTWTILGDINNDGAVDQSDLTELCEAFGSTGGPPPNANWNPKADLNIDNFIEILDLYILSKNYGQT